MKITNKNYFLPHVEALVPGRVFYSGRTKPNVIAAVCSQTGLKDEYVVKFKASPEMQPQSSTSELIAAFIGMELELNIPAPALVNISDAFVKTMVKEENYGVAGNSIGLNFGSTYKTGYQPLLTNQKPSKDLLKELGKLFVFDLLISNADRRVDKHNFNTNGKELLIFDHELAFGYIYDLPFVKNKEPWVIRDIEMNWITNNYCFNALRGKSLDLDEFIAKFEVLDAEFWQQVSSLIPADWETSHIDEIQNYTNAIVLNIDSFTQELNRILK